MKRKGILLTDNGELQISVSRTPGGLIGGGLVVGDTDTQNVEHLIRAFRGEYKEHPATGGEIVRQANSIGTQNYRRYLQIQLEAEGYDIQDIEILTQPTP